MHVMHQSFVSTTPRRAGNPGGFDNKFSPWRRAFDNKLQPERGGIDKLMYWPDILACSAVRAAGDLGRTASNVISKFFNLMLDVFQSKSFSLDG